MWLLLVAFVGDFGDFRCTHRGYHARFVSQAKVNDGVCDCCDGSDEDVPTVCEHKCFGALTHTNRSLHQLFARSEEYNLPLVVIGYFSDERVDRFVEVDSNESAL